MVGGLEKLPRKYAKWRKEGRKEDWQVEEGSVCIMGSVDNDNVNKNNVNKNNVNKNEIKI